TRLRRRTRRARWNVSSASAWRPRISRAAHRDGQLDCDHDLEVLHQVVHDLAYMSRKRSLQEARALEASGSLKRQPARNGERGMMGISDWLKRPRPREKPRAVEGAEKKGRDEGLPAGDLPADEGSIDEDLDES